MHVLNLRVLEKGQKVEKNLLLCNEVKKRVYKDTPDYLQAGYKMRKLRKKTLKKIKTGINQIRILVMI